MRKYILELNIDPAIVSIQNYSHSYCHVSNYHYEYDHHVAGSSLCLFLAGTWTESVDRVAAEAFIK